MRINVRVDQAQLLQRLEGGHKRFAFAVVNAINKTMRRIQDAEKVHARRNLTIRNEAFVLGAPGRGGQIAIIRPFASVGASRAYAEVAIGQKARLLLGELEEGGERRPFKGKSVAVPVPGGPARPTFKQPVPQAFRFTQLRLRVTPRAEGAKRRKKAKGGEAVRYGLLGTYQIPGVGVFQHVPGRDRGRPVYVFDQDERLPERLDFLEVARGVTQQWFDRILASEVDDVLIRRGLTRAALA